MTDPAFDAPEPADDFPVLQVDPGKPVPLTDVTWDQIEREAPYVELLNLLALYDKAETEAAEASERFEAIKKETKRILFELRPDPEDRKVEVRSEHLHAPLRMTWRNGSRTLDTKRVRKDWPQIPWNVYEKQGQGSWTLTRVKNRATE